LKNGPRRGTLIRLAMRLRQITGAISISMLVVLACATIRSAEGIRVRTTDVNGDGRPDIWQYYDTRGTLIRVETDTNFDGQPDVKESYINGHLIRRESDRDFDGRVDQIDEFDANSGARVRSVVDADFDGTADLLVLFANGRPVFSTWSSAYRQTSPQVIADIGTRHGGPDRVLWSLDDPFSTTHRFRADAPSAVSSATDVDLASFVIAFSPVRVALPPNGISDDSLQLASASAPGTIRTPRGPPTPVARLSEPL
jgi:hypothetical protein